jgi:hypothetical protein
MQTRGDVLRKVGMWSSCTWIQKTAEEPTSHDSSISSSSNSPSRRSCENPASRKSTNGAVAAIFPEMVRSSRLTTYSLPVAVVTKNRPVPSGAQKS